MRPDLFLAGWAAFLFYDLMSNCAPTTRPQPHFFWHTTPLHYLPWLLQEGALHASARFDELGMPLQPRATVEARDRKLGLSRFVHFSFTPQTPLLTDKLKRGFPHALLAFDPALAREPGAAYLPYNPKSWQHRESFEPITDPDAQAEFLKAWAHGSYASAELLIEGIVTLSPHVRAAYVFGSEHRAWFMEILGVVGIKASLPLLNAPHLFAEWTDTPLSEAFHDYIGGCRAAGKLIPPPTDIPFD